MKANYMTLSVQSVTARHKLPLLFSAQAQKEIFHNDALNAIDAALVPVVQGEASNPDALAPQPGQAWVVSVTATGIWEGHAGEIASATQNGWIFVEPKSGMLVMDLQAGCFRVFREDGWFVPNALSTVTGGTTVDVEARAAIDSIMSIIRNFRFSPPAGS